MSNVAMIGAGYVGLTTGACLAHLGHRVGLVDVDEQRIEGLRAGRMPILEEGLADLVADGSADLRYVRDAARQIGPHLGLNAVVVTKSTVPVGSAAAVAGALGRPDIAVVSNPEFQARATWPTGG